MSSCNTKFLKICVPNGRKFEFSLTQYRNRHPTTLVSKNQSSVLISGYDDLIYGHSGHDFLLLDRFFAFVTSGVGNGLHALPLLHCSTFYTQFLD